MSKYDRNLTTVFERLLGDGFEGTVQELADEIGLTYDETREVLNSVREPEFVDAHGWTIPYVQRGAKSSRYFVFDVETADQESMKTSQRRRAEELLNTTHRNIAQASLALTMAGDRRTRLAKHWERVLVTQRAAGAHVEALIEEMDEVE